MELTLVIDLPDEIQDAARRIEDLPERIAAYIQQQVTQEEWRNKRYSEKTRSIVEQSKNQAKVMRKQGAVHKGAFEDLFALLDKMTPGVK